MKNFQAHVEILLCLIKFILNEGALKWKKLTMSIPREIAQHDRSN